MTNLMIFIALGLFIVLLIAWVIQTYNKFITTSERVLNAKGQIAAQIESRWDAIQNLIQATKSYAKHEVETLENVVDKRTAVSANSPIEQIEENNQQLDHILDRLMVISEAYPDLKASNVYITTMESVDKYEDQVRHSRMIYNDSVTRFNRLVRMFPSNVLAGIFSFRVKEYFQETETKSEMPSWE